MKYPRPKFTLLTLLLFSLTCAAGMNLYFNRHPWKKISETTPTLPQDQFVAGNFNIDYNQYWVHIWDDPPKVVDLYNKNEFSFSSEQQPYPSVITLQNKFILTLIDVQWGGPTTTGEIWNLQTRKKVQTLPMQGFMVISPALSPNGRYLFDAHELSVIWDVETGRRLPGTVSRLMFNYETSPQCLELDALELQRQQYTRMSEATFLPDYFRAAHGPREMLPTTEPDYHFTLNDSNKNTISVDGRASADGSRIATWVSGANTVSIWEGDTLRRLGTITLSEPSIIYLSPDGSCLVAAGGASRKVYNTATGALVFELPDDPSSRRTSDDRIQFLNHGSMMLEDVGPQLTRLWNSSTGKLALEASPGGKRGALSNPFMLGEDTYVCGSQICLIKNFREELFDFSWTDPGAIHVLDVSPDLRYAVTIYGEDYNQRQIWRKVRPEQWWGVFYSYELYLLLTLFLTTLWSLFRRRSMAPQ